MFVLFLDKKIIDLFYEKLKFISVYDIHVTVFFVLRTDPMHTAYRLPPHPRKMRIKGGQPHCCDRYMFAALL